MNDYTAKDIKILSEEELDRFPWHIIDSIAAKYHMDVLWVRAGFEACYQLNLDPDFFIRKYILKEKLPKNEELEQIYIANTRRKIHE